MSKVRFRDSRGRFVKPGSALAKKLAKVSGEYAKGVEEGVIMAGLYLQAEAQRRVPVDEGNLKASASDSHQQPGTSGFTTVYKVVFSADYAVYVHEDLHAHHTVGEAKYLERAIQATRHELGEIVRNHAGITL